MNNSTISNEQLMRWLNVKNLLIYANERNLNILYFEI